MKSKFYKALFITLLLSAGSFFFIFKTLKKAGNIHTIINKGQFNSETKKVELSVTFTGVCSESSFKLKLLDGCRESYPVQCDLKLIHKAYKSDYCFEFSTKNIELKLPKVMFKDNYYKKAFITVVADDKTSISFQLPSELK